MRRRLRRCFPIVLIALLVQIFAPVGACWAASLAASDPLHDPSICSGVADSDQAGPAKAHHQRDGCCSACSIVHTGAPVDPPRSAIAEPKRQVYRVAWRAYVADAIAARANSQARARAPPHNS